MPIDIQTQAGRCQCHFSGELRIWEAADIWGQLYPLLKAAKPLHLDFQAVTACDGAGVQILCQVLRQTVDRAEAITFGGVSEAVATAMKQAGLDDEKLLVLQGGE